MEVKNTPLLFQQELNTFYKDILNCEITHPEYWDWKVPETFFLKRRKWIESYHDWWGDEVLDYINFDGSEYAIVRFDNKIRVMKWIDDAQVSSVTDLINSWRALEPKWLEHDFVWDVDNFNIVSYVLNKWGSSIFFFSVANRTYQNVTTPELFVTEYKLLSPGNIDYSVEGKTYWVRSLSWVIDDSWVVVTMANTGKSLFAYVPSQRKMYQVKLQRDWDMNSFYDDYSEWAALFPKTVKDVKSMCISFTWDRIFFVSWNSRVWEYTFAYNDITKDNNVKYKDTQWDRQYTWVAISLSWNKLYLCADWKIFEYWLNTKFDIDTISTTYSFAEVWVDANLCQQLVLDYEWFNFYVLQDWIVVVQLWFSHAATIYQWWYNRNVNHSFKRDFQSVKWKLLYWDWVNSKITWSTQDQAMILTPTVSPWWDTNSLAWCYVLITWWQTSITDTDGTWPWQIMSIISNTSTYLTVDWWDTAPHNSAYIIYDEYWEVLTFIWPDGLYAIHSDEFVSRYQGINQASLSVVDACWNNWRIFALLSNWSVECSAVITSDWDTMTLSWWRMSWFFNQSSFIWNTIWWMRIVPFNDIVCVFTNSCIYTIKKETEQVTSSVKENWVLQVDRFTMSLSFDFVWLHSKKAIIPYNTWIYFVSSKNTFLSLNIEESYYNKYKITTEDLWVDIQQWMDNIEPEDDVALWIDQDTIYIVWNWDKKSTIFQYDTYYQFWHRWETLLIIKWIRVDNTQTYLGPVCYRYNLTDKDVDEWWQEYEQHLRWFNWDTDIFSLKTILYHKLYLWQKTDLSTIVKYNARLSTWTYEYIIRLEDTLFLQKNANIKTDWVLGNWIIWFRVLGWWAEKLIKWEYISEVDVLEIPLWLTYSLLEITIEWNFEIGGNLLWSLVHDNHLTPYEDVVSYLDE